MMDFVVILCLVTLVVVGGGLLLYAIGYAIAKAIQYILFIEYLMKQRDAIYNETRSTREDEDAWNDYGFQD